MTLRYLRQLWAHTVDQEVPRLFERDRFEDIRWDGVAFLFEAWMEILDAKVRVKH